MPFFYTVKCKYMHKLLIILIIYDNTLTALIITSYPPPINKSKKFLELFMHKHKLLKQG